MSLETNDICVRGFSKWRAHPWHGLEIGPEAPKIVNAYVEITPFDSVKYEIDKINGYLKVDRPQMSSSLPPAVYGFIPKTMCSKRVAKYSKKTDVGDLDPLDICVLSERVINRAEVILRAKVIGVIKTIDEGKADDKIVAVLKGDTLLDNANDINDIPKVLVQRLTHYFLTYKQIYGEENKVEIEGIGGSEDAYKLVEAAMKDYEDKFTSS